LDQGLEFFLKGTPHQISRLAGYLVQHSNFAFALHRCLDGLFVSSANVCIAHVMAHLPTNTKAAGALADWAAIGDLTATVTSAQMSFASEFLA
jgi:hypothetical protein